MTGKLHNPEIGGDKHVEAEPAPAVLGDDLLSLLHNVAHQMRIYADDQARSLGMTRAQLMMLTRLERQPKISQSELAIITGVTPITIARLVDRLEELGLIERCADPKDRRIWRLRLTPAASRIVREFNRLLSTLHRDATRGIDPAALAAVAVGLYRMRENVRARRSLEQNHEVSG
jgi:MarR family transcriptional regulator for hemolysin